MRNPLELPRVLRVRLHAQTRREHELADGRAEAGQEGVERLSIPIIVSVNPSPLSSLPTCPFLAQKGVVGTGRT